MVSIWRRRACSVLVAAFASAIPLGAQMDPQFLPQVQVRDLKPSPIMTIGDGLHSKGQFNGATQQPFVDALASLPSGGTLLVGQGVYQFSAPVTIAVDRIHVMGSGAELRASADPTTGLFQVNGKDVCLQGLTLREDQPTSGHALVDVRAPGFRVRDCAFLGGDAVTETPIFLRVVLAGAAPGGLWIECNEFQPDRGWTLVDVVNTANAHINGNRVFQGDDGSGAPQLLRVGFRGLNLSHGEIRGNTFNNVGSTDVPVEALIELENQTVEGHHIVISGNVAHSITAIRALHLKGSRFNVIEGNSIGRLLGPGLIAAIDLEDNADGDASRFTTIVGNDIHNVVDAPSIIVNGGNGALLSGNLFSIVSTTCVVVGGTSAVTNVSILGNQFIAVSQGLAEPAVRITGGDGHAILGNTFRDFGGGAVQVTGVTSEQYLVSGNFAL